MQALSRIGINHTILLTGDHSTAAAAIARQIGISDFRAELLPEDKLTAIQNWSTSSGKSP